MDSRKIIEKLVGKRDILEKFKTSISNRYTTYMYKYGEIKENTLDHINGDTSEELSMLEDEYLLVGIEAASDMLSEVNLYIDINNIKKKYYPAIDEVRMVYPFQAIWAEIENLDVDSFFIAILSIIINSENDREIGKFFKNAIYKIVKENGFDDIYNEYVKRETVFIAMWFNPKLDDVRETIQNAIMHSGFTPVIIDKKEHINQIVPEIFFEIRNCAFLIADLTGQRQGVYYEAGYAEGLGKKVILTCNQEECKKCHFDVAQKNMILWDDPDKLHDDLIRRIESICIE